MHLLKWGIEQSAVKGSGFVTTWRVAAGSLSITLPLYNSGTFDCYVNWGDGTAITHITAYNAAGRIHTYATAGDYKVTITGSCPSWSFNNTGDRAKLIEIVHWGTIDKFSGFAYLTAGFYGCNNLTTLGNTSMLLQGSLTSLLNLFRACGLISIPAVLFRYSTSVTDFGTCFSGCSSLTSIPTDLFRYNTGVISFGGCFNGCTGLTSIPTDLFRYNTAVTIFSNSFNGCSSLPSIPTDLFRYNVAATYFNLCFYNNTVLASLPADLFRYNTAVIDFTSCFNFCVKLQLNSTIFYAAGGQSTRFLNKTVNFTSTFARDTFTGSQGTAPDLWNCNFGTGTPTTGLCFGGAGNSVTSLSNYASIPAAWK